MDVGFCTRPMIRDSGSAHLTEYQLQNVLLNSRKLESSLWFAFLIQGLSGVVQIKGYIALRGLDYLNYQSAFTNGAVAAMFIVLNLENLILGGHAARSAVLICRGYQVVGMVSCVFDAIAGSAVPNPLSFCCWFASTRLCLALGARQPANFGLVCTLGLLVAAGSLFFTLPWLLFGAFVATLIAGWSTQLRLLALQDQGVRDVIKLSAFSFTRFLPHTVAGLFIGFLDRYLALYFVDGQVGEQYLRALQLCGMSAFLIYPFVYHERNKLLKASTSVDFIYLAGLALKTLAALALAMAIVVSGMRAAGSLADINVLLLVTLLGIVCAQLYQVLAPVNFVKERFNLMNAITVGSAISAIVIAWILLSVSRSGLAIAAVLIAAWLCQVTATAWSLVRKTP